MSKASHKNELERHLKALPVTIAKKIISKYNKEVAIRGFSKMKKQELIDNINKKDLNLGILNDLVNEARAERGIKPKRVLTDKQKASLRKGRKSLKAKRIASRKPDPAPDTEPTPSPEPSRPPPKKLSIQRPAKTYAQLFALKDKELDKKSGLLKELASKTKAPRSWASGESHHTTYQLRADESVDKFGKRITNRIKFKEGVDRYPRGHINDPKGRKGFNFYLDVAREHDLPIDQVSKIYDDFIADQKKIDKMKFE